MPIKKTPNHLNLRQDSSSHVLNFFTNSKKAHFSISEGKLYEELENGVKSVNFNYQVHLTTYPFIAVHVLYGATFPEDEQHIEKIRQTLEKVMHNYLKNI